MAAATKVLRELGRRSSRDRNVEFLRRAPFTSSSNSAEVGPTAKHVLSNGSPHQSPSPATAAALGVPSHLQHEFLGRNVLFLRNPGMGVISRVGREASLGRSIATFSPSAAPSKPTTSAGESVEPEKPEEKKQTEKSLRSRILDLFLALENVPPAPLGLGLAGAIPFVSLTPGIASLLPMPEILFANHVAAQAAYGAVILAFLGGPHWGLAMGGNDGSQISKAKQTVRYIWSVIPSLVAWPALLLDPVPKFAVLITSFLVVLGVDATFARNGLLPPWYMPMRYLLTSIAMLSMTSSLIVVTAGTVIPH